MLESGASKDFFFLLQDYGLLEYLIPPLYSFLMNNDNSALYSFLDHADSLIKKNLETYERSILVSLLIYPILDQTLKIHYEKNSKPIHLGVIFEETKNILNDFIPNNFHLSRKMKAEIISILLNQYRFTPLNAPSKKRRIRIPQDPFFTLAMKFFKIRSSLDPSLNENFIEWNTCLHNFYNKHAEEENPVFQEKKIPHLKILPPPVFHAFKK